MTIAYFGLTITAQEYEDNDFAEFEEFDEDDHDDEVRNNEAKKEFTDVPKDELKTEDNSNDELAKSGEKTKPSSHQFVQEDEEEEATVEVIVK